ncbi:MAG: hypothetical protein IJL87_07995 [Clostridia bacterium]|nr:hypothetical protein [Clostridia bacterium]
MLIEKEGYTFSVDIEKTKEYYDNLELCNCDYCLNFYAQAGRQLPQIAAFLEEFGVDIERPDAVESVQLDDKIEYISVYYSVCGKITDQNDYVREINDKQPVKVSVFNVNSGNYFLNLQENEYFGISLRGFCFDWVLDKPLQKNSKRNIIKTVKQFFNKKGD